MVEHLRHDLSFGTDQDDSLHRILQLTDIARPRVIKKQLQGRFGEAHLFAVFFHELAQVVFNEQFDILITLTKRRKVDRDNVETIEEILSELSFFDHLFEVAVGRRNEAGVHRDRLRSTQALDAPLLHHPQQLDLQVQRHLADLVKKHRPRSLRAKRRSVRGA